MFQHLEIMKMIKWLVKKKQKNKPWVGMKVEEMEMQHWLETSSLYFTN